MIYKKIIWPFIGLSLILCSLIGNAQIPLLQNAINKLDSYGNINYQHFYKQKDPFGDTSVIKEEVLLFKTAQAKEFGYLFKNKFKYDSMKLPAIAVYDGEKSIILSLSDSTYEDGQKPSIIFNQLLLSKLNWLKDFAKRNPTKVVRSNDTIINSTETYHLIFNTKDTIVNNDHLYVRINLFLNKATGLPVDELIRARTSDFGKEVGNYFTEDYYFNYITDQRGIDTTYFAIPKGFHSPGKKPGEEITLLKEGIMPPDWTLYDTDNNKTTLSQLNGKVVLLDFFFVGCSPCMQTLAPLDKFYEKYKDKGLVILSISDRDNKKSVTELKKAQRIKNQMYSDGNDVAKLYHITAAPTFYFIDKQGKITSAIIGSDNFEQKATLILNKILND